MDNATPDIIPEAIMEEAVPSGHVRVTALAAFNAFTTLEQHLVRSDLPGRIAYLLSLLSTELKTVADAYKYGIKQLTEKYALRDDEEEMILPWRCESATFYRR